jgi:hypothetical protein
LAIAIYSPQPYLFTHFQGKGYSSLFPDLSALLKKVKNVCKIFQVFDVFFGFRALNKLSQHYADAAYSIVIE